mgnify:CR=1 FL=1
MNNNIPYKKNLLTSAITVLLGLSSASVIAAEIEDANQNKDEVEVIEVSGFRDSILRGQELKRNAVGSQDSIVASDIADFPNVNLAESLQRIPGVTITRDNGEGRQIALRRLGADFTRTQLNGMEALATNASILDSRGAVSRSRSFDYNIFASELFSQIDVYKSFEAKQDEGGIAGTVNLRTPKPFDYAGFKGAISAKASYSDGSEEINPRIAGLISNTWDDFGVTVTVAHSESDSVEFGHRNWGWDAFKATGFGPNIAEEDKAMLSDGSLAIPNANTISSVSNSQERLGITTAFQWRPTENISLSADIIYAQLDSDAREYNAATQGNRTIDDFEVKGTSLVYAKYLDADIRNESKFSQSTTEFSQFVLEADVKLSDDLTMKASAGYSKSEFDGPVNDKIYTISEDHVFSYDYRDSKAGNNIYDFDIADPTAYKIHRADTREDYISNEYATFKTDFEYFLNNNSALEFGAQYKTYESFGYDRRSYLRDLEDSGIAFISGPFDIATMDPFAVADVQASMPNVLAAGLNAYTTDRLFTTELTELDNLQGAQYTVKEETVALYTQYSIYIENVRANFGLRYITTDVTSLGDTVIREDGQEDRFELVTVNNDYSEWLPSFNFAMDLSDELLFRFSANRNLSRPSLGDLRASSNINFTSGSISRGNPELQPFIADSFEAAFEYYFGEINYFSIGVFSKDMASFVVTESNAISYEATGLPPELLPPGNEGLDFRVSQPINGNGASLSGAEIAAQYEFESGFGLIANLTYANSDAEHIINGEKVSGNLLGLSKVSYNLTAYYETEHWGARISQAARDGYLETVTGGVNDFQGVESTAFIDASIFYNVSDNLKVSLEGINLTNEVLYRFRDVTDHRSLTVYESGASYLLGVNYRF